jgi:quinol monooxygenase YgiN
MFSMVGNLTTTPENRDKLINILLQAAALMDDQQRCKFYIINKDRDDAGKVWVMELWDSKDAHDAALTLPEVRALIGQAMPLLVGQPSGASLDVMGGKGL